MSRPIVIRSCFNHARGRAWAQGYSTVAVTVSSYYIGKQEETTCRYPTTTIGHFRLKELAIINYSSSLTPASHITYSMAHREFIEYYLQQLCVPLTCYAAQLTLATCHAAGHTHTDSVWKYSWLFSHPWVIDNNIKVSTPHNTYSKRTHTHSHKIPWSTYLSGFW